MRPLDADGADSFVSIYFLQEAYKLLQKAHKLAVQSILVIAFTVNSGLLS